MAKTTTTREGRRAVYMRLREQFPGCTDVEFAVKIGRDKQQVYNYKVGRDAVNVLEVAERYPELDWNYILTGVRFGDKMLLRELLEARNGLNEIANCLQKIEEGIINK